MKKLNGKNAILTGASKGLGVHIAKALAREGVNLALAARSAGKLEEVRREIFSFGVNAVTIPTDLTDPAQVEALAQKAEQELGTVDILVNNAGVELPVPFEEYPPQEIITAMNVNLLGPVLLTRAVLPGMLRRGTGHIVNMASLAGKIGLPGQTPYASSKAGLIMFSHSLRAELLDKPVGVSVVCPGFVADDGMYARRNTNGTAIPRALKPTTTKKVVRAVIRAIRQDIAELTVNPLPMRPVNILREVFTGITPYIHKTIGVSEFVRELSAGHSDE